MLDPVGENFRLKFWPQCSLISVQFYPRNPGLNLNPRSTNSSQIAPQGIHYGRLFVSYNMLNDLTNLSSVSASLQSMQLIISNQ
jgi:hypothetical protein